MLLRAARFTTGYVRLVGQDPLLLSVLLSTSKAVRVDMRGWVLFFLMRVIGGLPSWTFEI